MDEFKTVGTEFQVANVDSSDVSAIEKYSHKIYEAITEAVDDLDPPQTINYQSLERHAAKVQETMENLTKQVFSKYIKLLDKKYAKRVKALDKAYLKILKEVDALRKFLSSKYKPKSAIEEGVWIVDDIIELEERYLALVESILDHEQTVQELEQNIQSITQQINELRQHPLLKEFEAVKDEFSKLQKDLDIYLADIRKALRKYINKSSKAKEKIDLTLAKEIVTDAASAFAEQSSTSGLRSLFNQIDQLLETNEIEMKRDKKDAARVNLRKLLDADLDRLWNVARQTKMKRETIGLELEKLDLEGQIAKLENTLEGLKRDMQRVVERDLREAHKVADEIAKLVERLEGITTQKIQVNLTPLPEFVTKLEK